MVYNKALAWQNEQYQADNTFKFSYSKIANLLPQWKTELAWLKAVSYTHLDKKPAMLTPQKITLPFFMKFYNVAVCNNL